MIVVQAWNRVHATLEQLNAADVEYCVLRAYEEQPEEGTVQEVDLLVAPEAMRNFVQVVEQLGFVAWPAWGHAPHHFFLFYDQSTGIWIKLDVVTSLQYGSPFRCLRVDLARSCLARRQSRDGAFVPAPEDEFLTLLLHCILDKRRIREKHRGRLLALWNSMKRQPLSRAHLLQRLAEFLGSELRDTVEEAIESRDWSRLLRCRRTLERRFFRQSPLPTAWRFTSTLLLRKARRLFFAWRRTGSAVALLAPDGGGKSSLAADLVGDPWLRARLVYMGSNTASTNHSLPTTRWLRRQLKSAATPPIVKIILKSLNTPHQLLEEWYRHGIGTWSRWGGRLVVYDRYIYDTFTSPRAQSLRVRARRWLVQRTCSNPDLVFFLDAPGDVLHRRKQEHSPEFLERQRQIYLGLQKCVANFVVIDATQPRDRVRREVISRIWNQRTGDSS